jgi:molybdopterin-guanine dinucleotide biosynthesis protein A
MDPVGTPLSAVVLAGGAARRFGSDKTRAELGGRRVLERVLDAAASVTRDVVVVGPWAPPGWSQHPEPDPGLGPLRAMAHGLSVVEGTWVLVLGGDHPLLVPALLELLVQRAERSQADAVVAVQDGRDQPLVACYRRRVAQVVDDVLPADARSLRRLLDAVAVERVPPEEWRVADPDGRSFLDVDTVEDLQHARRMLGE